ncbi:adenylate/guanylate cyclase domain-containing protein [archaeon]|nr:MAG: adenylate/guanylate cyclase domain-containing protein [archaeon]
MTTIDVNECLKAVLTQAVACGTEINEKCTDYRITFSQKPGDIPSPSNGTVRRAAEAPLTSLRRAAGSDADIEVIFLNVHAGVSAGLLASLCIGAMDRWEYLLLGSPLQYVAQAEGQAQKGQLVICPIAHNLLHGSGGTCTCKITPEHGCFVIYDGASNGKKFRMRKPEPKLQSLDAMADYETQFLADVNKFAMSAFHSWVPDNNQGGRSRSTTQTSVEDRMSNHNSMSNSMSMNSNVSNSQGFRSNLAKIDVKGNAVVLPAMPQSPPPNPMLEGFIQYVKTELTNALARYVHDVARNGYHPASTPPRHEVIIAAIEKANSINDKEQVSPSTKRRSALLNPFKFNLFFTSNKLPSFSDVANVTSSAPVQTAEAPQHAVRDGVTKRSAARKGSVEMLPSTDLIAELRSVIVAFINIDFPEKHELFVEDPTSSSSIFNLDATDLVENKINNFHFLSRSKREFESDQIIMQSFQRCYLALISCLHSKGGQLRQFIIDDKGIVCIGTFGLRGSNNDDNAAAAIESCNNIKRSLHAINIESYVGITSGKVYCGLVGSLTRHEYAVMGPSVNLSARLMARATAECQDMAIAAEVDRSILCDLEIQSRDRVHTFDSLGTIKAKGYSQPVAIYSPQLESLKERKRRHSTRSRQSTSLLPEASSSNDDDCKPVTSHDDDEPKQVQSKKSPNNRKKSMVANDGAIFGNISFNKEACNLYGRKNELQSIFNFLITKVCVVEKNSAGKKALKSLHTTKPAVMICLRGSQGIGKSSLMQNLCSVIDGVRYQGNPLNTFIAHHQISNFLSSEMLSLWKVLLPEVMTAMLYKLQKRSSKHDGLHIIDIDACLSYMRQKSAADFNKFSIFYPLVGLHSHGTETSDNAMINLTGQGQNISAFIVYVTKLLQGLIDDTGLSPIFAL